MEHAVNQLAHNTIMSRRIMKKSAWFLGSTLPAFLRSS
jgi:hypothetical protein